MGKNLKTSAEFDFEKLPSPTLGTLSQKLFSSSELYLKSDHLGGGSFIGGGGNLFGSGGFIVGAFGKTFSFPVKTKFPKMIRIRKYTKHFKDFILESKKLYKLQSNNIILSFC